MSMMEQYEKFLASQKQQAYTMEQHQIKGADIQTEPYRSGIEREVDALQASINYLEAVVETLANRLRPITIPDYPERTEEEKLGRVMSPMAAAFHEANVRVARSATRLQDLIERLEV